MTPPTTQPKGSVFKSPIVWGTLVVVALWAVTGIGLTYWASNYSVDVATRPECTWERFLWARARIDDQFGPVNVLFAGISALLLVITIRESQKHERAAAKRFAEEQDRQKQEAEANGYATRLQQLMTHHRQFIADPNFISARQLAWRGISKALNNPEFRSHFASTHRVSLGSPNYWNTRYFSDSTMTPNNGDGSGVLPWISTATATDDLLTFFSVFSLLIRDIERLAPSTEIEHFKEIVRQLNVYWEWWGPCLRYVEAIREATDHHREADLLTTTTPSYGREFDLLDRYYFSGDFSTAIPRRGDTKLTAAQTRLCDLLYEIAYFEPTWTEQTKDGKSGQETSTPPPAHPKSFQALGVW